MIHSKADTKTPNGSELEDRRDRQYSWPKIMEEVAVAMSEDQINFIYREKNGQGFCFRVKINSNRTLEPAGEL